MIDKKKFIEAYERDGFVVTKPGFDEVWLKEVRDYALKCVEIEYERTKHANPERYGALLCAAIYGGPFLRLLEFESFMAPFQWLLGDWSIVYYMGTTCVPPADSYIFDRPHVDLPRIIPAYHSAIGAIIALDDYTEENGATWFLPGSFNQEQAPDTESFYAHARRFLAQPGDVCYFNPRTWHAAGSNNTETWRCGLNLGMSKPWMKQYIDIPRFLAHEGTDLSGVSENVLQKLGFHCQPPSNFDEFYAPFDERPFRQPVV